MNGFYGVELAAIHADAFEGLAAAAANALEMHLSPERSKYPILDLGCGAGPFSVRMAQKGHKIWGLDVSEPLLKRARTRMPGGQFVRGSVLTAEFPRACAAVAVGEVLNYATAEDSDALHSICQRLWAALETGGLLLLDVAGPGRVGAGAAFTESANWAVGMTAEESGSLLVRRITTFRLQEAGGWKRDFEEHRLRLWRPEEIIDALSGSGFAVEQLPGYPALEMPPFLHVFLARKAV